VIVIDAEIDKEIYKVKSKKKKEKRKRKKEEKRYDNEIQIQGSNLDLHSRSFSQFFQGPYGCVQKIINSCPALGFHVIYKDYFCISIY
jgi:hypothetical protein